MGASYTPETWDAWTAKMQAAHGNGNGHGKSLSIEAQRLLPTPVSDNSRGLVSDSTDFQSLPNEVTYRWGDYAPAIARWETVLGRPAPDPTEPGAKGNPRLSPAFCEWLMGLPEGHVTAPEIGLTRNQALKALGNGVVPQQAAAATQAFLEDTPEGAVAS